VTNLEQTAGRRRRWTVALAAAAGCAAAVAPSSPLAAHTEASAVAVPAGSEATVTFRPAHGCGESPTVGVRIQAPVADATAGAVDGWIATATPDGAGNTVLEWTGGVLPTETTGAFPLELTVPDAVGTLLAFPAVQRCASGEELAWIGTAPGDEYPAPQVLVLPAGSEPAATLDDVPAGAPGRELLVALAEGAAPDDDPTPAAPTAPPATAAPTVAATTTTVAAATTTDATAPPTTPAPTVVTTFAAPTTTEGGDGGSNAGWVIAVVVAVVVVGAVAATVYVRRRRA
jgi:uncharacterized protein YcnI